VRGKGVEIRRSDVEKAYLQFQANAVLRNQSIPEGRREELEATLLDRLVVTQLLLNRATETDRKEGLAKAAEFLGKVLEEAGSEAAYERQLISLGFTREDFQRQIEDRAICEEVVEREIQVNITDAAVEEYYAANRDTLQRPEMAQVRHILFATRDSNTGAELSDTRKAEKRLQAEAVLKRARQGENFDTLVQEYSEDLGTKDSKGEYIFARGQMVPEFEAAAFSLGPNAISDLVTTVYGYHIIKKIQSIPSEPIPLDQVREDIRLKLRREKVQDELLPRHLEKLKEGVKLQYLNGARPPSPTSSPDLRP